MKLLITGIGGQLGSEILKVSDYENFGIYLNEEPRSSNGTFVKCDITNRDRLIETIKKIRPDWVLHLASATKVEWCEENKEAARRINVDGTKNVVEGCKEANSNMIFISSDSVFDGKKGNYKEDDKTNPINFYGKTKLDGEQLVKTLPNHVIGRSCLMYSSKMGTFTSWVLDGLKKGDVEAAVDITSSPTLASELAECLLFIVKKDLRGIYHTAGDEAITKYEFIKKFAEAFGHNVNLVKPVRQEDLELKALRPKNSSLDISKIKSAGFKFSKVDGALRKLKKEVEDQ